MYNFLSSSAGTSELLYGSGSNSDYRREELSNKKQLISNRSGLSSCLH